MRLPFLCILFCFFTRQLTAQNTLGIVWQKTYGSTAADRPLSVVKLSGGGYAMVGSNKAANGDVSTNKGLKDAWIIRTNNTGDIQWQKSLGGNQDDEFTVVRQSGSTIWAGGYSASNNNGDVPATKGSNDAWIVKLDEAGNVLWQKTWGATGSDAISDLIPTADGGCVFVGNTNSTDGNGDPNVPTSTQGYEDAWIVKINSVGTTQWQFRLGGNDVDEATSIDATLDGGYIIGAYSTHPTVPDGLSPNKGSADAQVIKLSSTGVLQWERKFGGSGRDACHFIKQLSNGDFLLTGTSTSADFGITNQGDYDIFVVRLNASGTQLWQRTYGGSDNDLGYDGVENADGTLTVGATSSSSDGNFMGGYGFGVENIWLLKLSATGNLLSSINFGGFNSDKVTCLISSGTGRYVVGGTSMSTDVDLTTNKGLDDWWFFETGDNVSCSAPTGLLTTSPVASSTTAYPPARINWNAVSGANNYDLLIENSYSRIYGRPTGSPYSFNNYGPNSTYTIKVRSRCSNGSLSPYASTTYLSPTYCALYLPYSLTAINITNNSATLNGYFPPPGGDQYAPQYDVQWRLKGSTTWTTITGASATYSTIYSTYMLTSLLTGLQPGNAYEWQVRSRCLDDGSLSEWVGPVSFTTTGACTSPTIVTTQNITQSSAQINWSAVANATSYNLVVQSLGAFPGSFTLTNLSGTTYALDALSFNTPYRVQVISRCASGALSAPASVTFSTLSQCATLLPENLAYRVTGINSLSLSWSVPYLTAGFDLRWQVQGATTWNLVSGLTLPSYTLTGLSGSTNYSIEVRSRCSDGGLSAWVAYPTLGTGIACTASNPINLTTTGITSSSALLLWQIPYVPTSNFATKYNIRWTVPGLPSRTTLFDVPVTYTQVNGVFYTAFSLTGLSGNTTYEWEVQAVCALGDASNWVGPVSFTTPPNVCPYKPDIATTSTIAATSAVIASGIQSYAGSPGGLTTQYQWRVKNPSAAWIDIAPSGGFGGVFVSASLTGLTPNTAYEWQVRIRCSDGGLSDWKGPVSFTTLSPTCAGPVSVFVGTPVASTASTESILQAPVSWSPVSGVSTYEVRWFSAANPSFVQSTSGLTGSSYTLTGLSYGNTYTVQLRGLCSSGGSSSLVSTTVVTPSVCSILAPLSLTTTGITSQSALLDWGFGYTPGGYYPSGFELQWRIKNTTNWNTVTNLSLIQSEYSLTGLTGGTAYEWQVRSRCGQSEYTNWVGLASFTTLSDACLYKPNYVNTEIASTSALLVAGVSTNNFWPGEAQYQWRIKNTSGPWNDLAPSGGIGSYRSASLTGLTPNTAYEWQVRTRCLDGGLSDWAGPVSFTTLTLTCAAPASMTVSTPTASTASVDNTLQATVRWASVSGAVNYEVRWYSVANPASVQSISGLTGTSYILGGLLYSTNYIVQVQTRCTGVLSSSPISTFVSTPSICPYLAPNSLTTTGISSSSSLLDWSFGYVAGGYYPLGFDLEWRAVGSPTWNSIPNLSLVQSEYKLTGLTVTTRYEWRVRTQCGGDEVSDWVGPVEFTTQGGPTNTGSVVEYFFDADPGYGNGTPVVGFTLTATPTLFTFQAPIPNSLTEGLHFLSLRAQDGTGGWSVVGIRPFFKNTYPTPSIATINQIEYFIDSDPGYGLATVVPITSASVVSNLSFTVPVSTSLSAGFHLLTARARDDNNQWSVVAIRPFFKETLPVTPVSQLVAMEYFIDADPGYGLAIAVTDFTQGTAVAKDITVALGTLTTGAHKLTIRGRDANGQWSIVGIRDFFVQDNLITTSGVPASVCRNTPFSIPFTATGNYTAGNIFTALLSDALGSFSNPTVLGSVTATTSGVISATIPPTIAGGAGYQVRIVSSSPSIANSPLTPLAITTLCECLLNATLMSGNWSTPGIWSCGRVPLVSDLVRISSGHTVLVDQNTATCKSISLWGTLQYQAGSKLTIVP